MCCSMNLIYCFFVKFYVGNVCELNEDVFFFCEEKKIWCLVDGMGGYDVGEVVLLMVVDVVVVVMSVVDLKDFVVLVCDVFMQVNWEMIYQWFGCDLMMGSMVLVLLVLEVECVCIWVGDSWFYLYWDVSLFQMSKDYSVVQEFIDKGVILIEEVC